MNTCYFGASHQGLVREENQDAWGFRDVTAIGRGIARVVADGMGGHSGGRIASNLAVETFLQTYAVAPGRNTTDWIERAFAWANQAVLEQARTNSPALSSMGTTLSVLVFSGKEIWMGTAGDTRVHLIRNGRIQQISQDDTITSRLLSEGSISQEEAENHLQKHVLTKVIGSQSFPGVSPVRVPVISGDTFLISTDGLYNLVHENEILSTLCIPTKEGLHDLIEMALQRGGDDNITAACISFSDSKSQLSPAQSTIAIF